MASGQGTTRWKIWELPSRFHCGLIGTCLELDDLHHLCRRAGIEFQTPVTDYELHHAFVDLAGRPCHATRLLQRRLDSRHRTSLRRFAPARDEAALAQLWDDARECGDVAGAYWALMSHRCAGTALRDRAAGDVHMLSHLAGASQRNDRQRLLQLQQRVQFLERSLREERRSTAEHRQHIQALNLRLTEARGVENAAARLETRIKQLEGGEALRLARRQNEDLAALLAQARLRAERQAADASSWAQRCRTAERTATESARELAEVTAERDSLEQLARSLTRRCEQECSNDCPGFDLCRRRILYVGGRPTLNPHLRQLVEQANGEFLHHDGGREEADSALAALVPGADAVLCPVDCVSHSAMQRVKRICKQQSKPFLALRNASISSFARGLQRLVDARALPLQFT